MTDLLCLHGFLGSGRSWDAVIHLLGGGSAALCPDLPGHATAAPPPRGATFESEIERFATELGENDWTRGHLVGYSMGARFGLGLLVRFPELFSGATLVGLHPGPADGQERSDRRRRETTLIRQLETAARETAGLGRFVDRWEANPLFASQRALPADVLAWQRQIRLAHDPASLAIALEALGRGAMPDYAPQLAELEQPLTLVVGELDDRFRRIARDLEPLLRQGRLSIVPGAGHNPVLERPRAIAALLREELQP